MGKGTHCARKIIAGGIFGLLLMIPVASFAQESPGFVEAYQSLSETTCNAGDIGVGAAGELLLTGYFSGHMILGGQEYRVADNDASQMFLAKFDDAGVLSWLRTGGGAGDDQGTSLAVDASGNSLVTGNFSGTARFGGGTNDSLAVAAGVGKDMFLAKYSAGGGYLWGKKAGVSTSGGEAYGLGVAVDGSGSSYVTGAFMGSAFSPAVTSQYGFKDIFLAKYNSSGVLSWSKTAGGAGADEGLVVAADASGAVLAGRINGSGMVQFPPLSVTGAGGDDAFVARYDVNGSLQWVKRFGGTGDERVNGIRLGGDGKIYLTGEFTSPSFSFGGATISRNASGGSDIFVAVYSSTGAELLALGKGGSATDSGRDIVVDGSGNFTVVGSFQGMVDLGGVTVISKGGADMFVASYTSAGALRFALSGGGGNDESARSAVLLDTDTLLVSGAFNGLAAFGEHTLASVSKNGDMFASLIGKPSGLVVGVPGDFTGDQKVSLADVLGVLRLLAGQAPTH